MPKPISYAVFCLKKKRTRAVDLTRWNSVTRSMPGLSWGRGCRTAGLNAVNDLLELDDAGVTTLLQKTRPLIVTPADLLAQEKGDLLETGGRNSRLGRAAQAFKKELAAGVPIIFGSGATRAAIP